MRIIICLLIVIGILLFMPKKELLSNSLLDMARISRGDIIKIEIDKNIIWVKSNQFRDFKIGAVLYVHMPLEETKAIAKIIEKNPFYIKAHVIDGNINNVNIKDEVNNIYEWDAYQYLIELQYEQKEKRITIEDKMIIENKIYISSMFGQQKEEIDGRSIQEIKFQRGKNTLKVVELVFSGGEAIKVDTISIKGLKSLEDKIIKLDGSNEGQLSIFDKKNLSLLKVIKPIRGVKKQQQFHYSLSDSVKIKKDKEKYQVTFRFLNLELGFKAIEELISKENDSKKLNNFILNLKNYKKENIKGISVLGSFNNWDGEKNPMKLNSEGFYETKLRLLKGNYPYYFKIYYTGKTNMELKILDPYVNTFKDEYECINEDEYIKKYIKAEMKDDSKIKNDSKIKKNTNPLKTQAFNGFIKKFKKIFLPGSEEKVENLDTKKINPEINSIKKNNFTDKEKIKKIEKKEEEFIENEGVNGKFSIIDLSKLNLNKFFDSTLDNKKNNIVLPFSNSEIDAEKYKFLKGSSFLIDKESYRKVKFKFNQLNRVKTEIKRMINNESRKNEVNYKKIKNLYILLEKFDEKSVNKIAISGDFNNWNLEDCFLKKLDNGIWSDEYYIPAGQYRYKFAIHTEVKEYKIFLMNDLYSADYYFENDTEKISILNIPISFKEVKSKKIELGNFENVEKNKIEKEKSTTLDK